MVVPQGDKVIDRSSQPGSRKCVYCKNCKTCIPILFINEDTRSLALKGTDVLKNNWFFLFVDAMKEMKTPVFGFEALKNFRFNTAKPANKDFHQQQYRLV